MHVADVVARQNALRTGEVDVIDKPDTKTLSLLSKVPGVRVIEVAGNTHYTFPMLMDKPPYDDYNIRQAMKHAIDRQAILDVVLNGHGYIGNDHPISKSMRYHNDDLPQREYDPDRAKYYLQQAGLSSLDVSLAAADIYPGGMDAAVLYREHAAKAGINLEIERVSTDSYWSDVWNVKPLVVSYWSGRPTEDLMLTLAFSNTSSWNETHWNNEQFESILKEARAELDDTRRKDMYGELQRLIHDEGGLICPVFANNITVVSDKLQIPDQVSATFPADGLKTPNAGHSPEYLKSSRSRFKGLGRGFLRDMAWNLPKKRKVSSRGHRAPGWPRHWPIRWHWGNPSAQRPWSKSHVCTRR